MSENAFSHDAIARMLYRLEPSPEDLLQEVQAYVQRQRGILALDDTMLEKLYAQYIELVAR